MQSLYCNDLSAFTIPLLCCPPHFPPLLLTRCFIRRLWHTRERRAAQGVDGGIGEGCGIEGGRNRANSSRAILNLPQELKLCQMKLRDAEAEVAATFEKGRAKAKLEQVIESCSIDSITL